MPYATGTRSPRSAEARFHRGKVDGDGKAMTSNFEFLKSGRVAQTSLWTSGFTRGKIAVRPLQVPVLNRDYAAASRSPAGWPGLLGGLIVPFLSSCSCVTQTSKAMSGPPRHKGSRLFVVVEVLTTLSCFPDSLSHGATEARRCVRTKLAL